MIAIVFGWVQRGNMLQGKPRFFRPKGDVLHPQLSDERRICRISRHAIFLQRIGKPEGQEPMPGYDDRLLLEATSARMKADPTVSKRSAIITALLESGREANAANIRRLERKMTAPRNEQTESSTPTTVLNSRERTPGISFSVYKSGQFSDGPFPTKLSDFVLKNLPGNIEAAAYTPSELLKGLGHPMSIEAAYHYDASIRMITTALHLFILDGDEYVATIDSPWACYQVIHIPSILDYFQFRATIFSPLYTLGQSMAGAIDLPKPLAEIYADMRQDDFGEDGTISPQTVVEALFYASVGADVLPALGRRGSFEEIATHLLKTPQDEWGVQEPLPSWTMALLTA